MRMHTALHVMSAVIKGNVTGGQVGADKSRLDFNLEGEVPTKEWVTEEINKMIAARPAGDAAMGHRRGTRMRGPSW